MFGLAGLLSSVEDDSLPSRILLARNHAASVKGHSGPCTSYLALDAAATIRAFWLSAAEACHRDYWVACDPTDVRCQAKSGMAGLRHSNK
ncbi:hypothetical protein AC244_34220 [Ensifer adhaerens]|uniref:Uncharacterized protein n=1 Tax=Ensifer adhaerens TaxID=106592 RepID=A0A0L8BCW5_ENSAD|nr:hypothetical protein AC244_34220 [Ensifer adhaerens]